MRNTVLFPVLFLVLCACVLTGCAGKYADVKKANAEFVRLTDAYLAALDKTENAAGVAKAMNRYADGMEKTMPGMRKLSEKYPELKDRNKVPEGLKQSQQEAEAMGKKMAGTFMKIMPYMNDPAVVEAQKRLTDCMTAGQ